MRLSYLCHLGLHRQQKISFISLLANFMPVAVVNFHCPINPATVPAFRNAVPAFKLLCWLENVYFVVFAQLSHCCVTWNAVLDKQLLIKLQPSNTVFSFSLFTSLCNVFHTHSKHLHVQSQTLLQFKTKLSAKAGPDVLLAVPWFRIASQLANLLSIRSTWPGFTRQR